MSGFFFKWVHENRSGMFLWLEVLIFFLLKASTEQLCYFPLASRFSYYFDVCTLQIEQLCTCICIYLLLWDYTTTLSKEDNAPPHTHIHKHTHTTNKLFLKVKSMFLPPCHLLKTTHPLVPSHISLTPPSKLLFLPPSIQTCHSPSNPCCLLHLSHPLFPSPPHFLCLALPLSPSTCYPIRPISACLSPTYRCPRGSLCSPPSPSFSAFWHSMCRWWTSFCVPSAPFPPLPLPSSRPTYSTGAHHTCGRVHTHTHSQPRAVNVLLGHSELYSRLTAGGVPGFRGQNRGE